MSNCSNSQFTSDLVDIVSRSSTNELWNPMTKPINSTFLRYVRSSIWLLADGEVKVKVGVQASDDGITWSDDPEPITASYATADAWTHLSTWVDLESVAVGLTQRNFFRIGVLALNTSDSACRSAQCRVALTSQSFPAWSRVFGPRLAWTKKSSVDALFVPFSGPVMTDRMNQIRATIDRDSSSGKNQVQAAYQETDTPDDPTSWGTSATTFGSTADDDGILYPTSWTTVTFTKRYVRFGVADKSHTDNNMEAIRATLRVDARET